MKVRVRHIDFPVPRLRHVAIALARRRFSVLELYLLPVSGAVLLVARAYTLAIALPVSALCVDLVASRRTWDLVAKWRAVRRRRIELNGEEGRERRRVELAGRIGTIVDQADYTWRAYAADAVVGRTQSVMTDRPAPKIQPLKRLHEVRDEAGRLAIDLIDDDPSSADARLGVPPEGSFGADLLSPAMMNVTAASIAHAKAEGQARAQRRHAQMIAHAAEFGQPMAFAEHAVAALREPAAEAPRRWWRRRPRG